MPENLDDLAFCTVLQLAELLKTGKVTSTDLTKMYLARLKKYNPILNCVVSITEELALAQAAQADAEISVGNYKGVLHGVPYGAKDLLAVKGYKTTWGAAPYKDQYLDMDATVVERLREAGAILVAKLSMGQLAGGDIWFNGQTKNPHNLEEGSSGSSAGSGSATAAGLVGFSIGTETWGSIVSPATRNSVSGLRPTYGRVSRYGAMALSWSMDKIGPMCRSVEDCAVVFNAIYGADGKDSMVLDAPFNWSANFEPHKLKVGYLKSAFEQEREDQEAKELDLASLDKLRELGIELIPIDLPDLPVPAMKLILFAEAAAAFDEITRDKRIDLLDTSTPLPWSKLLRTARMIPAVEYIQANRLRSLLIEAMHKLMSEIDVYVAPSLVGHNLLLNNLSGHPCVVVPNGVTSKNKNNSISFVGKLFGEAETLSLAKLYQDNTAFHLRYPKLG
jgi:Asp-tRNA(Asn)/Glu-tRNA(Gln) amidotransferase A subunit family amidase